MIPLKQTMEITKVFFRGIFIGLIMNNNGGAAYHAPENEFRSEVYVHL